MGIQVWARRDEGHDEPQNAPPSGVRAQAPAASGEEDIATLDWDALRARVLSCTRCALHEQRAQAVFGVGNRTAQWLIIGEAPGAEEDRQGEPFVGRAGKLLNNMLLAIGLKREEVYIANIVKCRPPNNREPTPEEAQTCAPYLARQISLIKPNIILAVGRVAAQNLLKTDRPVGSLRGKRFYYEQTDIPVVVTYHPAYLLRSPQEKRKAWQDLLAAKQIFSSQ
ncbi:MAG: uracil-DNA glycosylase [Gammaproteobacteria bacterium]